MHASIGVQDFTAPGVTVLNFTNQSANVNVVAGCGPIIFWHGKVPEWNKELEMLGFYCLILCFMKRDIWCVEAKFDTRVMISYPQYEQEMFFFSFNEKGKFMKILTPRICVL